MVAVVINIATELTINWNHITDVDSISSAGQMIPLIIGAAAVVRIFYKWRYPEDEFPDDGGPTDARDLPLNRLARPYYGPTSARDPPARKRSSHREPSNARDLPARRVSRYRGPSSLYHLPEFRTDRS